MTGAEEFLRGEYPGGKLYRGSVPSRSFAAFYLLGPELRAALGVNRVKDVTAARKLIQAGRRLRRSSWPTSRWT